jgi:ATP-dependent Clp protease ATP-binding subunit ClpA
MGPAFTAEAKQALELAFRESIGLSHQYVGAEHLLLALAQADGPAADVLRGLDADPAVVRARVLDRLGRVDATADIVPFQGPGVGDGPIRHREQLLHRLASQRVAGLRPAVAVPPREDPPGHGAGTT